MTVALPGVRLTDHWLDVPLVHADPGGERITIYAREVAEPGGEERPWLLFLQGGPGGRSPRPNGPDAWLRRALRDYRVLLLDQRGTGRSSPVTPRSLAARGDVAAQAQYLAQFRADAIVGDAELLRHSLTGGDQWTTLGQSYGGFCTLTYLSLAPEGLRGCLITGGLAGLDASAEDVYRRTYRRMAGKNEHYYTRYPQDADVARRVVDLVAATDVRLPTGERLSPERVQSLGHGFGGSTGYETLHYLLEDAVDGDGLSPGFLAGVVAETSFAPAPLYAVLHEACYAQGEATRWAAQRVRAEFPAFDPAGPGRVLFTGEMVYPWMLAQEPSMHPYVDVADRLAARSSWPALYDLPRLSGNEVPVVAAVYHDDAYVDADYSLDTARRVGNVRTWVTNEYEHDGLRVDGERVLGRLLDMLAGRA